MTATSPLPTLSVDRRSQWTFIGMAGRAVLSMVVILAVARSLGTEGYGVFAGMVAFVTLLAPISTLGIGETLVQEVSRDRSDFGRAWGSVLVANLSIGVVLYVLTVALASVVLPGRDMVAIALLGAMEFVSAGLLLNHGRACAALDRFPAVAAHQIGEGLARAGAALIFWYSGSTDLRVLALLMFAGVLLAALVSTVWLAVSVGRPQLRGIDIRSEGRAGIPFAVGQTSAAVQANVDKTMLVSFEFDEEAGIYAAGYRMIAYAMMPVMSVLAASYPEFFRRGKVGFASAMQYSRELRPRVIGLGVLAGIGAVALSPIAAWILADQFGGVVPVVVALSVYPVIKGLQLVTADVLTGSGHQSFRARAVLLTAVLNIGLNLALIPDFTWKGAVAATYLSELAFLAIVVVKIRAIYRRRQNGEPVA
ncbi:MAG: oligosaccharide flippase family protein [Acidimicrobiales bacterium]